MTEESINVFHRAFVPFRQKKEVMSLMYYLAEHTVFLCLGGKQGLTVLKRALEVDGEVIEAEKGSSENEDGV